MPYTPKIKVPGNLIPAVQAASDESGVPFAVIAATIQARTGWPNALTSSNISQVAQKLAAYRDAATVDYGRSEAQTSTQTDWTSIATSIYGGGNAAWATRFNDIYGPSDATDAERWVADTNNAPVATSRVTVPANFVDTIRAAAARGADATGVDAGTFYNMLSSLLNQESGIRPLGKAQDNINKDGSRDRGIAQISNTAHPDISDAQAYDPDFAINWAADYLASRYNSVDGTGTQKWINAAAAYNAGLGGYHGEVGQAYGASVVGAATGGGVAIGDKVSYPSPSAAHTPLAEARSWADPIAKQLTGQPLSDAEMNAVVSNGWNPAQFESYLRSQKYGNTDTTIGIANDVRTAIMNAFARAGLPDPTEGQINFAIVNHIPAANADAYAEQTKSNTVWASDPTTFMTARAAIKSVMNQYGIVVAPENIDANLVNQATTGKWSIEQIKQAIGAGQMPGAPTGTTVDHYSTTASMADSVWKTYFPTTPMPASYTTQFLGFTPDQITAFIRSLPSPEAKAAGVVVGVGAYTDAKNAATAALSKLGAIGRAPTPQEIASFASAKGGTDVEAIQQHYATDPGVLAINPGAQYGMTREAYTAARNQIEKKYNQDFGGIPKDTLATDAAQAANPVPGPAAPEPDWMKQVFKEGLSAQQSSQIFDDYFKRLGAPPSASDIDAFNTRSTAVFGGSVGGRPMPAPAISLAGGKPVQPDLGTPDDTKRGFAA